MIRGIAVKADLTVTFAFEQPGHYIGKGRACTKEVRVRQIGITKESLRNAGNLTSAMTVWI